MSQLIETIRIKNGRVYNIHYHNSRCNHSRSELFGCASAINLRRYIKVPQAYCKGLVKCRIIYNEKVLSVDYSHYNIRQIQSIELVYSDNVDYQYKFKERGELNKLREIGHNSDEILIVKNGFLTDAFYYNIIIEIDGELMTPKTPLLKGVMISKLIAEQRVRAKDLTPSHLDRANKIFLVNALTQLGEIELSPLQVNNPRI